VSARKQAIPDDPVEGVGVCLAISICGPITNGVTGLLEAGKAYGQTFTKL